MALSTSSHDLFFLGDHKEAQGPQRRVLGGAVFCGPCGVHADGCSRVSPKARALPTASPASPAGQAGWAGLRDQVLHPQNPQNVAGAAGVPRLLEP